MFSSLNCFKLFFFVDRVVLTCFELNQVVSGFTKDSGCCYCFVSVFFVEQCFRLLYVVFESNVCL